MREREVGGEAREGARVRGKEGPPASSFHIYLRSRGQAPGPPTEFWVGRGTGREGARVEWKRGSSGRVRALLQRQNGGSRTETRGSALGCGRHCSPGAPIAWPSSTTLLQRRCAASVGFLPALTTRCHETARAHYDPKRPDRRGQRPTSSCCCCGSRLPLPPIWSALWFGLKASAAPATGPALPTTKYPPPTSPTYISPTH